MLKSNMFYGFKASDAYNKLCNEYGFNTECAGRFRFRQRLYSSNASPEGYGAWFIANSNWTKSKGGTWQNTIAGNYSWIEEKWDDIPSKAKDCFDFEKRVVFAKDPNHSNGYIFLGVYKPVSYNDSTKIRRFERVAAEYQAV